MEIILDHNSIFLLMAIFVVLLFLQGFTFFKTRVLLNKVLEILIRINEPREALKETRERDGIPKRRICKYCRHRMVFINCDKGISFYHKCQLNNQYVNLEDFCHCFKFDPQNYEAQ